MAKERSINPATAALKASKAKQIKKSKANLATQRNEKLARRNPHRLQKQIDDLKQSEENGSIRPRDKQILEQLEKDLRAVQKAREALGDKAPKFNEYREQRDDSEAFGGRSERRGVLGKRRRDGERQEESETDEDVRDIPMPKDTENMPPLPRRRNPHNANETPLGGGRVGFDQNQKPDLSLPSKPVAKPSPVVLESAPVIRDLRKEAVSRFVPSSVAQNIKRLKGEGDRLLEPEEADRLEQSGYKDAARAAEEAVKEAQFNTMGKTSNLEDEAARLEKELQDVEMQGSSSDLRQAALLDGQRAADEAVKEAEYNMMIEELEGTKDTEQRAARHLRRVEIEEVEDEDL
jgi:WW domain binding protein 11